MTSKLIPILVAGLFAGGNAVAADDAFTWSGSVGIGARGVNTDGSAVNGRRSLPPNSDLSVPFQGPENKAKASEYRDLEHSAVLGTVDVEGSNNRYYLRFFGENFGLDDQYLNLRGGSYGDFKYQFFHDKMPHNLSWNALTPFGGTGGAALTSPGGVYPNAQNPASWNTFDYQLKRKTYGGNVEFSFKTPWFIRADYNEMTMEGVRPGSARLGTGSGNGFVDLGMPTDYKTKNFLLDGGYSVKKWSVALNYTNSRFTNGYESLQFPNFYMQQATDTFYTPPENQLSKWSANGTVRELPGNSTLAGRISYSSLTNNVGVPGTGLLPTSSGTAGPGGSPTGVGYLLTAPSSSQFNGNQKTKTGSLSFTSNPMKGLDTKLYYNYYDKQNDSTVINYAAGGLGTNAANCPANASINGTSGPSAGPPPVAFSFFCMGALNGGLYEYKKQDFGVDAGYRFYQGNKISGGYQNLWTKRDGREDATKTEDRKLWVEYKNTMLENLAARVKYQNLDRNSRIDPAFNPGGTTTPTAVAYYYRAYDISNFNQDQWKFVADWAAIPFLDIGVEYAYKKTDYKDLLYGRTDDKRDEYNLTASYGDPKKFRVTALANWENIKFNQAYRNTSGTATAANAQGAAGINDTTNFNWGTKNTQTNRLWALMADWPVIERLTLHASYTWMKTGGGVDFTSTSPLGTTVGCSATTGCAGSFQGLPLVNYVTDNTKKQTWTLKGKYSYSKNWDITGGYTYEKYTYADDQMRGFEGGYGYYQYIPNINGTATTNSSWLSGAFANPSYKVQVLYVMGTYKFD